MASDGVLPISFATVKNDYKEFMEDPNKKVLKDPTKTVVYFFALATIGAFVSLVSPFIGFGLVFSGSVLIGFFVWGNRGAFFKKLGPDLINRICSCFQKMNAQNEEPKEAASGPETAEQLLRRASELAHAEAEAHANKAQKLREAAALAEARAAANRQRADSARRASVSDLPLPQETR